MTAELIFYQDVETIFDFIKSDPEKILEYNPIGNHLSIIDIIGGKVKMTKVTLKHQECSELEIKKREI